MAESLFGSLKKERIKKRIYKTWTIATAEIAEHIELSYEGHGRAIVLCSWAIEEAAKCLKWKSERPVGHT